MAEDTPPTAPEAAPAAPARPFVTVDGKQFELPEIDPSAMLQSIVAHLRTLRRNPVDLLVDRYERLKDKPELLDRLVRLVEPHIRTPDKPLSIQDALEFLVSIDGAIFLMHTSLKAKYPEVTEDQCLRIVFQGQAGGYLDAMRGAVTGAKTTAEPSEGAKD